MTRIDFRLWLSGIRPRTLPASIAPVVAGAAAAWRAILPPACPEPHPQSVWCTAAQSRFDELSGRFWPVLMLCMLVALLLQIAVNFANDYSDGIRGTDEGRNRNVGDGHGPSPASAVSSVSAVSSISTGPKRLVASGVPARKVLMAAGLAAAGACACGIVAIVIAHAWWLFAVGAASLLAGWFYTGGRHPYGYAGFGEASVFVFFGLAAVLGTEYALTGTVSVLGALAACACGLNAVMLLMINNLRDVDSDRLHGKRTLAVRLGVSRARLALAVCAVAETLIAAVLVTVLWAPWGMVLVISGLAVTVRMVMGAWRGNFREALMDAGYQSLFFAVLFSVCAAMAG